MRRAAHDGFNARASTVYQPLQEKESALLASQLLLDPVHWDEHIRRFTASLVMSVVYGWSPTDSRVGAFIGKIYRTIGRIVHACMPGACLVEIFPSMLHLPAIFAKWKREGLEWFRKDTEMFEGLFDDAKTKLVGTKFGV